MDLQEFLMDTSFVSSAVCMDFSGLVSTAGVTMNYTGAKQGLGRRSTKALMAKN